jgi:PTS system galactitol-specific IIC component
VFDMGFVDTLNLIINTLGSTVLLPVFIFIFALILGAKVGRAFRASVTIAVAFIGINLVIGLFLGELGGVSQALTANIGVTRDIVDVGWPAAAAVAFATDVGLWVIPVALLVNFVLLIPGVTKTLNVDVWNFWHYAFAGSLVTAVTGSLPMGLAAAAVAAAFMLFLGDWTAKGIQQFYELPGISIPHGFTAPMVIVGLPFNWLFDKIPGLRDVKADPDGIEKSLGSTFGDPMIMGMMIGVILGLIAYFAEFSGAFVPTLGKILILGLQMAAVMVLFPRMVQILMEGLIPISEAAREFMSKRASDREVYIGLDSAVLVGHPSAISTGLLLVPIAIGLSLILPGNRMILFADLAVLPFLTSQIAPMAKGNIVRMVFVGTFLLAIGFYVANALAPAITQVAGEAGFAIPENAVLISSIADGFVWPPLAFMWLGDVMGWIGIGLFAVVTGVLFFFYKKNEAAWDVLAGANPEE